MAEIVLTPGQRAAVESRGCALLVAAAAGSGKTRVLIDRVLDQVIREGRRVDEFLLITFTQAAAAELRGKLLAELNRRLAADPENRHLQRQLSRVYLAQISTVHSFCAALLRDYAHVLELPADFRLADEQEAAALRERAVRAVLEEAYADPSPAVRAALDLPGAGRDDRALQELIVRVYTNLQCYPDPAATADRWAAMLDVTACTDPGQTIWGEWLLRELQRGLQSDAAMLRRALALAEENEAVSAYVPVLQANLLLLEALASAGSWEALARIPPDFGRFPAIRKCADPGDAGAHQAPAHGHRRARAAQARAVLFAAGRDAAGAQRKRGGAARTAGPDAGIFPRALRRKRAEGTCSTTTIWSILHFAC